MKSDRREKINPLLHSPGNAGAFVSFGLIHAYTTIIDHLYYNSVESANLWHKTSFRQFNCFLNYSIAQIKISHK